MQEYDFVFVVLVYRNIQDLAEFQASLSDVCGSRKLVVVNSFFDEATKQEAEDFCRSNGADFINCENRGYGYGNNCGIQYVLEHYKFRYMVLSNPDIIIQHIPDSLLKLEDKPAIYGPLIKTRNGKRQNPCLVFSSRFRECFHKEFVLHPNQLWLFYLPIAANKLERGFFNLIFRRNPKKVYALHGSFLLFSNAAVKRLKQPFNPDMFLFREEDYLARAAKSLQVEMIYYPQARIFHKEDGSVRFISGDVKKHTLDSLRVYYGLTKREEVIKT